MADGLSFTGRICFLSGSSDAVSDCRRCSRAMPADRAVKGRSAPWSVGSSNAKAKLSDADVMVIRSELTNGAVARVLAERYGVCSSSIKRIKQGLSWRHLGGPVEMTDEGLEVMRRAVIARQVRGIKRRAKLRTYCVSGHALIGDNVVVAKDKRGGTYKFCKLCHATKRKAHRDRNPAYRLSRAMARSVWGAIRGDGGDGSFSRLPYTVKELMNHLEGKFCDGMDWSNYGDWHVDHIKPRALFDHSIQKEFDECWSLGNLQPLWAIDNIRKGARYEVTA